MTKGIAGKWKEELVEQERQLFMEVYDNLETKDGDDEMTKTEFDELLATLPPKYRMQIQHQHTFEELAGDNDTLSYQEFSNLLDRLTDGFATTTKQTLSAGNLGAAAGNGSSIVEETA